MKVLLAFTNSSFESVPNSFPAGIASASNRITYAHIKSRGFLLEINVQTSFGCNRDHQSVFVGPRHF